ncbi:hypothetical protein [Actinacidiphila sp. bgisy167]|uniref:hypothetical protein n=1 Tax=Actinacidiphila sp. bgisy167 TaxID=3413797 RepID=UPI003D75DF1D
MTEQNQSDDAKAAAQAGSAVATTVEAVPSTAGAEAAEPAPTSRAQDVRVAEPPAAPTMKPEPEPASGTGKPEDATEPGSEVATEPGSEVARPGAVSEPVPVVPAAEAVTEPSAGTAAEDALLPEVGAVSGEAVADRPRKRLRDRRALRAAVRWTAAVVAFAALGGAAAYAVTQPERTEIPGLRTPHDGRWTYPALKLPKLPAGAPRPQDGERNRARRHYADVRSLLLPAPAGAKVDKTFPGATGWLQTGDFVELYRKNDRGKLTAAFEQNALRHIAARAWTTSDGTRAEVYLLQFETFGYAAYAKGTLTDCALAKAEAADYDSDWEAIPVEDSELNISVFDEDKPRGAEHVRYAYVQAGDVLAVIVLARPGTLPAVPLHQAVVLQSQLLG